MNVSWSRLFKSTYRKEPITSFIVIVGAVDTVIGGVDQQWSLLTFGLGTLGVALGLRWWMSMRSPVEPTNQAPKYYLPAQSSRPALPKLTATNQRPPQ